MFVDLESIVFIGSKLLSIGSGVDSLGEYDASLGVGIWVDNGVLPGINGVLFNQTKGRLSGGDSLWGILEEWGLNTFFQAPVDDALLDLDADDAGDEPLIIEGSRRGWVYCFSIVWQRWTLGWAGAGGRMVELDFA